MRGIQDEPVDEAAAAETLRPVSPDSAEGRAGEGGSSSILRAPALHVVVLFALSRLFYLQTEIEFDDSALWKSWQLLDPALLRTDLVRSLWNLHSQPPLFNLFSAMALRIAPTNPGDVLAPIFTMLGMANLLAMDSLLRGFRVGGILRWIVLVACAFSPSFILMESWYFYAHPLTCMMTLSMWAWMRAIEAPEPRRAAAVAALLFAMSMTSSTFHLAWYMVLVVVMLVALGDGRRRSAAILVGPGLAIFAWYLKNLVLFGSFGASTWLGMSLAKNTTFRLSDEERAPLVRSGRLTPYAMIPPFRPLYVYSSFVTVEPTGVPALDEPETSIGARNLNHLAYISVCEGYRRDAIRTLRDQPLRCLESQIDSWANYFQSSSIYFELFTNRGRIGRLGDFFDRWLYLQVDFPKRKPPRPGRFWGYYRPYDRTPVAFLVIFMFASTALLIPVVAVARLRQGRRAEGWTLAFLWLNVMYVSCVGNLLEIGENNRFRFMIEPISWIALAVCVQSWLDRAATRFRGASVE